MLSAFEHKIELAKFLPATISPLFNPHLQTEPTPLDGKGLVSLNAFGFGGSNAHVILLPNDKEDKSPDSDVFFVNGRTPGSVSNFIDLARREPKRGQCLGFGRHLDILFLAFLYI